MKQRLQEIQIAFGAPEPLFKSHFGYISRWQERKIEYRDNEFQDLGFQIELWRIDEKSRRAIDYVCSSGNRVDFHESDNRLCIEMIRGMICLGFDVKKLEEKFKYEPTFHERLEWQLEYQARLEAQGIG